MSSAMTSKQAAAYLLDPLTAPEPSQETGPGSHFMPPSSERVPTVNSRGKSSSTSSATSSTSNNPFRKSSISKPTPTATATATASASSHSRQSSREFHNSPTGSPKPFPRYREEAFTDLNEAGHRRSVSGGKSPVYDQALGRRRGSSLKERYPGDMSVKPLDMLRKDSKKAHRSPHLQKKHLPGTDTIDRLDAITRVPYHHEGPYDAALLARNTSFESSPVAAVADSNREALKATPAEKIREALEQHRPLDGTAVVPPGVPDGLGRVYHYEEGTDLMREPNAAGGPYGRYSDLEYSPDDLKGKGEPQFSLDKALRTHAVHERDFDGHRGIEMSDRPLMGDYNQAKKDGKLDQREAVVGDEGRYAEVHHDADVATHVNRTSSLRRAGQGLKKRLSIRKKSLS